jgi:hypothetical protein
MYTQINDCIGGIYLSYYVPVYNNPMFPLDMFQDKMCSFDVFIALYCNKC